jgi:hypothetical protein
VVYEVTDFFSYLSPCGFDFVWDYTFFCALDPEQRSAWGPPWPINAGIVRGFIDDHFEQLEVTHVEHTHPGREGRERLAIWRRRETQSNSGNGTALDLPMTSEKPSR